MVLVLHVVVVMTTVVETGDWARISSFESREGSSMPAALDEWDLFHLERVGVPLLSPPVEANREHFARFPIVLDSGSLVVVSGSLVHFVNLLPLQLEAKPTRKEPLFGVHHYYCYYCWRVAFEMVVVVVLLLLLLLPSAAEDQIER